MKKILVIIIIFILTGCATSSQVIVKNKQCAVPARVELKQLDNKSHIGSEKNTAVLMLNIADLIAYVKSLEASIACFENIDKEKDE